MNEATFGSEVIMKRNEVVLGKVKKRLRVVRSFAASCRPQKVSVDGSIRSRRAVVSCSWLRPKS